MPKAKQVGMVLEEALAKLQKKYRKKMPKEQTRSVEQYQEFGKEINKLMEARASNRVPQRVKNMFPEMSVEEYIDQLKEDIVNTMGWNYKNEFGPGIMHRATENLDSAIGNAPTYDQPLQLYRKLSGDYRQISGRNPAYLSSSTDPRAALDSGYTHEGEKIRLLDLTLPEDKPFLYLGDKFDRDYRSEMEVLLPRGKKLKPVGKSKMPEDLVEHYKGQSIHDDDTTDDLVKLMQKYRILDKKHGGLVRKEDIAA